MCCVSATEDERGETTTISDGLVISVDTYYYCTLRKMKEKFLLQKHNFGTKVRLP